MQVIQKLKKNGIIFNKHGHVVELQILPIGLIMPNEIHQNHVVLKKFVHHLRKVVIILMVVVMDQHLIFTSNIQKH